MKHYTTKYILIKDDEYIEFNSEREACQFLGVVNCSVASCYRRNSLCKGYTIIRVGRTTHNQTNTRLFRIWSGIKERCQREKHIHYKNYGGRGITICDEWDNSFEDFSEWAVANGYNDNLTIDRIDVNGNYEPSNCRWVSVKEQMNNKRNNNHVCVNNETMTVAQCSEKFGISKSTIIWRKNNNRDILTGAKMDEE